MHNNLHILSYNPSIHSVPTPRIRRQIRLANLQNPPLHRDAGSPPLRNRILKNLQQKQIKKNRRHNRMDNLHNNHHIPGHNKTIPNHSHNLSHNNSIRTIPNRILHVQNLHKYKNNLTRDKEDESTKTR